MTNRKSYLFNVPLGPSRVTIIRVLGPQYGETVYISEVAGSRKVKSHTQVAMNKNGSRAEVFFLGLAGEDSAPNSNYSTQQWQI